MKHSIKKITFPTYLTLIRLIFAPILVPFLIVQYASHHDFLINFLIAFLFLLFGLTDYLDGFFARKYSQESKLGASLDHIADKFLTFSALIALLAVHKISYVYVLLLVGREIYMMGLREISLENGYHVKVGNSGKIKTVLHIILISWIIMNPMHGIQNNFWNRIEILLLFCSLLLSLGSAFQYSILVCRHFKK
jgi:CDP-diacylglycerol--glycerol-3-phosphate 3-phosphatidyltransferase